MSSSSSSRRAETQRTKRIEVLGSKACAYWLVQITYHVRGDNVTSISGAQIHFSHWERSCAPFKIAPSEMDSHADERAEPSEREIEHSPDDGMRCAG